MSQDHDTPYAGIPGRTLDAADDLRKEWQLNGRSNAPAVSEGVDADRFACLLHHYTIARSRVGEDDASQERATLALNELTAYVNDLLARQRETGRREGAIIGHADALSFGQRRRDSMAAEITELLAVRAAFYVSMLKAYPGKSHDEIQAEIEKSAALATRQPVAPEVLGTKRISRKRMNELAQDAGFVLNAMGELVVVYPHSDARAYLHKFAAPLAACPTGEKK